MIITARKGRGMSAARWRFVGWAIPVLLLLLPLLSGAPWTREDYMLAGGMFLAAGLTIELALRSRRDNLYRAGAAVGVAAAFLLVLVNLSVGFLGDERNDANLVFLGVLAVALAGSLLARFRAAGMAWAMLGAGAGQLTIGLVAPTAGWIAAGRAGLYELVMGTSLFTGLWLAAAFLFARSARRDRAGLQR